MAKKISSENCGSKAHSSPAPCQGTWPVSEVQAILYWQLENMDSHTWILLFELLAYRQDSFILESLSQLLLQQIIALFKLRQHPSLHWHWADLLQIFHELISEQELLQQSGTSAEQAFAWLKLRTQSFAQELNNLWQGPSQKTENYSQQFGIMLALSSWRLCIHYFPLSSCQQMLTHLC